MADCHIGGWREDKLNELTIQVFRDAIDICIKEHVAFILIAGDLFDTALPNIDLIKEVASILEKVKRRDIEVYIIPGSHDFSPSGKTFLDVLENSGLVINVNKYDGDNKLLFFEDKTGVKITGLLGKRSGLEREDYKNLEKEHLENEKGFKIFMFHTTLEEFKPKYLENVKGQNYADLPKNFNYYAGGHVHYLFDTEKDGYGKIVYPGPLFPNNFKEIEELKHGGFCIVNDNLELTRIPIKAKDVLTRKLVTISPEATIHQALEKMNKKKLRRLPVVNNKKIVGYVTLKDIVKFIPEVFEENREFERIREESEKMKKSESATKGTFHENICEECGNFDILLSIDGRMICESCKDEM